MGYIFAAFREVWCYISQYYQKLLIKECMETNKNAFSLKNFTILLPFIFLGVLYFRIYYALQLYVSVASTMCCNDWCWHVYDKFYDSSLSSKVIIDIPGKWVHLMIRVLMYYWFHVKHISFIYQIMQMDKLFSITKYH